MSDRRWSARVPVLLGLLGLLILVGGFGYWATQTQIAGAIIAPGRIEVDQNRQIVQHPEGGVVAEIGVEEGDSVEAGDLLLQLDVTQLRTQLAIVESQLYELMARRGRLEAERDDQDTILFDDEVLTVSAEREEVAELIRGQENLFVARRETSARTLEQLAERSAQTRNQIIGIEAHTVVSQRAYGRVHSLAKATATGGGRT